LHTLCIMADAAEPSAAPAWMRRWLVAAGVYNLLWGSAVVLIPDAPFSVAGLEPLTGTARAIWQCLGMVIGVYGVGYLAASTDPLRHWPITLVGFLGKVFGPIGFVWTAARGDIPWNFGLTILTNDLLWWVPFGAILLAALKDRPVRAATIGRPTQVRS
jgi:small multidrug resistance pump